MTDAPPRVPSRRVGPAARALAAALALLVLSVLVVAARLNPSPEGHGTHRQLGLPPCGWVIAMHKPCPTCGMTTAFAHAAHASPAASVRAQPMGALGALTAAVVFWGALHVALTGSRLGAVGATILSPRTLWGIAGLTVAAWLYKMATWQT